MTPRRRFSVVLTALSLLLVSVGTAAPAPTVAKGNGPDKVGRAKSYYASRPARQVARSQPAQTGLRQVAPPRPKHGRQVTSNPTAAPADPLAGLKGAQSVAPPPFLSFDGTGNPAACSGCIPSSSTGDVGPNNYVQMVNTTKVAIYDKAGTLVAPVFDLGTLWPSTDNCFTDGGDPQVVYDRAADRWLLSQFTAASDLCFAISTTPDPTGTYHLFRFVSSSAIPVLPKVGVGPGAYFVGTEEVSDFPAYAFDRTKMLAGDATASFIKFTGHTNFLMPADLDGPNAVVGNAGYFYSFKDDATHGGADRLELFELHPDFVTPGNSTLVGPIDIPIVAFTYTACGQFTRACIRQPVPATEMMRLDQRGEYPMQRLVYRNFLTHETLLGSFSIRAALNGPGATGEVGSAIRWFELRKVGTGAWTLHQEGTHDPADGHDRWMASVAMDGTGNIALGYSVSSTALYPSIRYATRAPGDPLGTLGTETSLMAGSGVQTSTVGRWGDYSSMTVDPSDDCTFWYTNQYYAATSATTWSTRIGAFRPACPGPPPTLSIDDVTHAEGNAGTTGFTFTVTRSGDTSGTSSVDYRTNDGSATAPSDYTSIPVTTVSFAASEATRTVTVSAKGDTILEPNETFTVDLSNPVGATIADSLGLGTITNDDSTHWGFAWVEPTLTPPAVNHRVAGSVVTVEFMLGGDRGVDVLASGWPKSKRYRCSTGELLPRGRTRTQPLGNAGLTYDPATGVYTYSWQTAAALAGKCRQFQIRLADGSFHFAKFKFSPPPATAAAATETGRRRG